jgi:HicA toxin of bacterial toxin-antitoxin,
MKRKHQRTLELIFSRPVSGSVPWRDIEALLQELGGEVSERAGSRVAVGLFGEVRAFHRPHPSLDTDRGAVASIRKCLEEHGVTP